MFRKIDLISSCANGDILSAKEALANGQNINGVGTVLYPSSWIHQYGLSIVDTTPILEALSHGHLELAMFLLEAGANLNHITRDGYTAAHLVAYIWPKNAIEILGMLHFEKGFRLYQKDKNNFNVFDAAKAGGNPLHSATKTSYTEYNFPHISLLFDNQQMNRGGALMMFDLADLMRKKDDGLCRAIKSYGDQISDKKEHLVLVKCLVEYCNHTNIKGLVQMGGFSGLEFQGFSAYTLAKEKGYDYIVSYFDRYLASVSEDKTPDEKKEPSISTTLGIFSSQEKPSEPLTPSNVYEYEDDPRCAMM